MNSTMKLLFLSLFFLGFAYADAGSIYDEFVGCLSSGAGGISIPKNVVSKIVYDQNNKLFTSVLDTYVRNRLFNTSATPKPAIIVTPTEEDHVGAVVLCSKKSGVQIKTRSGGHDYEGLSYVSAAAPFIVLDLFNLRSVDVDIAGETAWVQAGATVGEILYGIWKKSPVYGFPAGVCPTLGAGGHISSGGYGTMIRKYGLASDNVVDARIVDVNGKILDRSAMGEDLFWAINGAGGSSFGVIVAFKLKLVSVPEKVTYFRLEFSGEEAVDVVLQYQEVASTVDNDLFIRLLLGNGKNGAKVSAVALFLGDSNRLVSITDKAFPALGLKQEDCIEMTWIESVLQWSDFPYNTTKPEDALLNRIQKNVKFLKRKSDYVQTPIPKDGVESLLKKIGELGTSGLVFNAYGGRMAEIPADQTPFPHRAGNLFKIQYSASWSDEGAATAEERINHVRELHNLMTPYVSKNPREKFLNYRDIDIGTNDNGPRRYEEAEVYGRMYFKNNFDRLVKVKTAVDPDNFFWNEQSIPPLSP